MVGLSMARSTRSGTLVGPGICRKCRPAWCCVMEPPTAGRQIGAYPRPCQSTSGGPVVLQYPAKRRHQSHITPETNPPALAPRRIRRDPGQGPAVLRATPMLRAQAVEPPAKGGDDVAYRSPQAWAVTQQFLSLASTLLRWLDKAARSERPTVSISSAILGQSRSASFTHSPAARRRSNALSFTPAANVGFVLAHGWLLTRRRAPTRRPGVQRHTSPAQQKR